MHYGCRYGHFSGINRKVQLTYLPHGQPKTSSEEEGTGGCYILPHISKLFYPCDMMPLVLFVLRVETRNEGPSLLLVLKWGGELTPAGRVQAEELGRAFRCMYPGGQGALLFLLAVLCFSHSHVFSFTCFSCFFIIFLLIFFLFSLFILCCLFCCF